jgi:glyoxylase-like metal-dependent hydrolase (beta-lactamase superfamily II)
MSATQLVPGVWWIALSGVNAYLVEQNEGLTLVDAGRAGDGESIVKAIRTCGHTPADLTDVLITHYHGDHRGSAAHLRRVSSPAIAVHGLDRAVVEHGARPPKPSPRRGLQGRAWLLARLLLALGWRGSEAVSVNRELRDGDRVGGIQVVHTPGHTPGHCSFVWQARVLFAGDALDNTWDLQLAIVNEDHDQAEASLRRLANLEFGIAVFGHGPPCSDHQVAQLRVLCARAREHGR